MVWNDEHVQQWVEWTIAEYGLSGVNAAAFSQLDGTGLCRMTKDDFYRVTSPKNADVLISHLNYLRSKSRMTLSYFVPFLLHGAAFVHFLVTMLLGDIV